MCTRLSCVYIYHSCDPHVHRISTQSPHLLVWLLLWRSSHTLDWWSPSSHCCSWSSPTSAQSETNILTSCQWLATLWRVGLCTAAADCLCIPSLPRNLRNSLHGLIIINICFALLGLYLFFLIAAHVTAVPGLCGLVSALLHYFILVFFAWTAAEAVYLYIKLVKVMGVDKYVRGYMWKAGLPAWSKLLGCYLSCYGLLRRNHLRMTVVPAMIVIISLGGYQYYTSKY